MLRESTDKAVVGLCGIVYILATTAVERSDVGPSPRTFVALTLTFKS